MVNFGHNGGPSFDEIVETALRDGLLIAVKNAFVWAIRDDRIERRHLRILAEVVECLNHKSGMAYPGRKKLADVSGYSEMGVAQAIKDLTAFGSLVSRQQAPETGGRAISHYAIRQPSKEEMEEAITTYARSKRPGRYGLRAQPDGAGVKHGVHTSTPGVKNGAHTSPTPGVNPVVHSRKAGVNPVDSAGVNPVAATVTSRELEDRIYKQSASSFVAAREDADGLSCDHFENTTKPNSATATIGKPAFDLTSEVVAFIAEHVHVEADVATKILRGAIAAHGKDAMLEAFVATQAEMATGLVATPYKYLLKVAEGKKREREKRAGEPMNGKLRGGPKFDWKNTLEETYKEDRT